MDAQANSTGGSSAPPSREVLDDKPGIVASVTDAIPGNFMDIASPEALPDVPNTSIFTRATNPFKPEWVAAILKLVKTGPDLSDEQRMQAQDFIASYADIFALSVSEVFLVEGATYAAKILPDHKFSTKVHQKPMTPPQEAYLQAQTQKLVEAGVIRPIHPRDVKCVSPIKLAQKEHDGAALLHKELKRELNVACEQAGLPLPYKTEVDLGTRGNSRPERPQEQQWRICQNFHELKALLKVVPVPQGDIQDKQRRLAGHRYVSVFDFASGFFALRVDENAQPYLVMFVPGMGYFAYMRMPFGLTDAPTEFGAMCADKLSDLLVRVMELFVDNGGSAADTFEEMMDKLRLVFDRVRLEGLSLSVAKTRLFMTEAVFVGAMVGPQGVTPDPTKLTAVVGWKTLENATNLAAFLGLTGYFRDIIQNYAREEAPLWNLLKSVPMPPSPSRQVYQTVMKNFDLQLLWTPGHTWCFLRLKQLLLSAPVLRAPLYDTVHKHPFIITTDGSKDAFAGVLSQKMESTTSDGRVVVRRHPIAFASKRTSVAEERYQLHLLEFAALKFALDKFSNIVWGQPIWLETDCQALRDILNNEKLNATHTRWLNGLLGYNIVGAEHIKGLTNAVADALSRAAEGTPKTPGNGSESSVSPDWEARTGLTNDLFSINDCRTKELVCEVVRVPEGTMKLWERFKDEPMYQEVVDALTEMDLGSSLADRKRARHRALQYFIEEGQLWRAGGGTVVRGRSWRECLTREEARQKAVDVHAKGGHFHRDAVKLALMDKYHSPGLDDSIMRAIADCAKCKGFGPANLHALMNPITRRQPFKLIVGDYLSMPDGKGGFKTIGLFLDVFSQFVWGFKLKESGSAKSTTAALEHIFSKFHSAEVFMSDNGSHFANKDVEALCKRRRVRFHKVAAYSPWINGPVEGANRILLYILARLCAPEVGEDTWKSTKKDDLPRLWPDHFDTAIETMNDRLLPAVKFSPRELLFGLMTPTPDAGQHPDVNSRPLTSDMVLHMEYAEQLRLDGYAERVKYAMGCKAAFDRKVMKSRAGVVAFEIGNLVQVFRSDLANTVSNEQKLTCRWSEPHRVQDKLLHSVRLESVEGTPIDGVFNARRLRQYVPRAGTQLAIAQAALKSARAKSRSKREMDEATEVGRLRQAELDEVE
ncbi:unnamed protein product [Mycena citricolor]|uniref:Integrase catalytic domain-containing protein n=1 Tax=Mycena citricolor TaxID=2018698 RepID=A0AAD2K2V2_9AGAR|nr:unnamed protein product [Mycena citricolor]